MSRWKVILAVVVIFFAGATTGGVLVRNYFPKEVPRRIHPTQPIPLSLERRHEYVSRLDREVTLTDQQRKQVEAILAASQERMKRLWEPVEPKLKEEYRRTRKEISDALTPEQQEKMKRWHAQREQRWRSDTNAPGTNGWRGDWRERRRERLRTNDNNGSTATPLNSPKKP